MKPLLLILALGFSASAQDIKQIEQIKDWKLIKEMSGEISDHPGLTVEVYAAQIARGNDLVKLALKADFPQGAPVDVFRDNVPFGFDVSSITRLVGQLEFDCVTRQVRPSGNAAYIYQFNGRRLKTKEPPFAIPSGHIFYEYFCEHGEAPTKAPVLKPKP